MYWFYIRVQLGQSWSSDRIIACDFLNENVEFLDQLST